MISTIISVVFPPRCLLCHRFLGSHGLLCNHCWYPITFLTTPCCYRCGFPFEYETSPTSLCAACIQKPPCFDFLRSTFIYNQYSQALITRFKYHDVIHSQDHYARLLALTGKFFITECNIIIPVPMHPKRLITRRYNHAALLAQALSKQTHIPYWADGLKRKKHTRQQTGLTHHQRMKNLQGAFIIDEKQYHMVYGKRVLLIDDVITTGATIETCSRLLKKAGADKVFVLTLAHRLKEMP